MVVLSAQKLHETKTNVGGSDQKMAIYEVRNENESERVECSFRKKRFRYIKSIDLFK